jgi:hypothetical protein
LAEYCKTLITKAIESNRFPFILKYILEDKKYWTGFCNPISIPVSLYLSLYLYSMVISCCIKGSLTPVLELAYSDKKEDNREKEEKEKENLKRKSKR